MTWPLVKLGELVNVKGGKRLPKGSTYSETQTAFPYIRVTDFENNSVRTSKLVYIEKETQEKIARYVISNDDVYISIAGTIGIVGIVPEELDGANLTENAAKLVINDTEQLNKNYLVRFLSTAGQNQLHERKKTTSQPKLALFRIEEVEIPLPPLAEQKRIAAILDKADAIRRKRQQAINLADDFLRSVFLDMFGDPVKNTHKLPTKPWSAVLKIINGRNQKKVQEVLGEYPIMGSGGEMGRSNDYLCPENTVIIGRKGNINKPILVKEKFWNVDTAFGLFVDEDQLSYNYLFWFCKFFNFERLNKTVTIPSLTKSDLLILKIPLPSIDEQKVFDMLVEKIDVLLEQFKASELKSNNSFNSLSQKAFAGEL